MFYGSRLVLADQATQNKNGDSKGEAKEDLADSKGEAKEEWIVKHNKSSKLQQGGG